MGGPVPSQTLTRRIDLGTISVLREPNPGRKWRGVLPASMTAEPSNCVETTPRLFPFPPHSDPPFLGGLW